MDLSHYWHRIPDAERMHNKEETNTAPVEHLFLPFPAFLEIIGYLWKEDFGGILSSNEEWYAEQEQATQSAVEVRAAPKNGAARQSNTHDKTSTKRRQTLAAGATSLRM